MMKNIFIATMITANFLLAQSPHFSSAKLDSNRRSPQSIDGKSLCGSPLFSIPGVREKAVENTRKYSPAVYKKMIEAHHPSLKKIKAVEDSVGSIRSFFVYNFKTQQFNQVYALLLSIGNYTEIWVDTLELINNHVTMVEVNEIRNSLENSSSAQSRDPSKGIVPLDEEFFGQPPNINEQGIRGAGSGRTTFLVTDIKEGWDSTSNGGFVGGFFSSDDEDVGVPGSNQRDMLYIDSYPGIYYNGTRNASRPLSTLAHEFQHLIHYNYDQDEETWVNEGLSEYAEVVTGFPLRSPDKYFSNPDVGLKTWRETDDPNVLNDYSRVALWTLFCAEQNGDEFIRDLVQSPLHGTAGFGDAIQRSGAPYVFQQIFSNWLIANAVNNRSIDSKYGYRYHVSGAPAPLNPSLTNPNVSGSNLSVPPLAGQYFEFAYIDSLTIQFQQSTNQLQGAEIQFNTNSTSVLPVTINSPIREYLPGSNGYQRTFIISNVDENSSSSFSYSASGPQSYVVQELKYDNGTPQTFSGNSAYFGIGNGYPGYGFAVRFSPANPMNRLIGAKLYIAFDNEFSNGTAPADASKIFDFHVWGDQNGLPGQDLITPFTVTVVRDGMTDDFTTVNLITYGDTLSNLAGPIYIGFTQSASNNNGVYVALNGTTQTNYTFGLIDPINNRWEALSDLQTSSTQTLAGYNMMMRAQFLYKQKETVPEIPVAVGQSYPNPFVVSSANSTVQIPYTGLPGQAIALDIYNVLGEKICTLQTIAPPDGKGNLTWNGRNSLGRFVASGLYFYMLKGANGKGVGKMVVVE